MMDILEDFRLYLMSFWPDFYAWQSDLLNYERVTRGAHQWFHRQALSVQILVFLLIVTTVGLIVLKIWYRFTIGICKSTARMDGKTVIVTGANNGIGLETARDLARRGARVILACRNLQRGMEACRDIMETTGAENVVFAKLDLASLKSIREFADHILRTEERLDVLILNAGVALTRKYMTEDNLELHMACNHFGHFLLTNLLFKLILLTSKKNNQSPCRIIAVSSVAHKYANLELDNLNSEKYYDSSRIYGNTKLANILFVRELARRFGNENITANALHPGAVQTGLFRNIPVLGVILHAAVGFLFKSSEEGAQTSIFLAVDEDVAKYSGQYFSDCKQAKASNKALDPELAIKLWNKSVECVNLDPEEEIPNDS